MKWLDMGFTDFVLLLLRADDCVGAENTAAWSVQVEQ